MKARTSNKRYDVIVAGGGVAGVAAATAAARAGCRTALIEKTCMLGGLATAGMVTWYPQLDDGKGNQVTFGLAEELLLASLKYGPGCVYGTWAKKGRRGFKPSGKYSAHFNAASFALALDELLLNAGVALWFDTLVTQPLVRNNRLSGLEVWNKSGRSVFEAACFVDATGDADIAFRAGAPCIEQKDRMAIIHLEAALERIEKCCAAKSAAGLMLPMIIGYSHPGTIEPVTLPKEKMYRVTNGRELAQFVIDAHKKLLDYYRKAQAKRGARGRDLIFPLAFATLPDVHKSRRIEGRFTLTAGMAGQQYGDAVGLLSNWMKTSEIWSVPYGVLVPKHISGLLAAGRCVSADEIAWDVTRVIQGCALTGELAGVAAALAVKRRSTPDALPAAAVGIKHRYEPRRAG